jgi:hypothetical protein
MKPTIERAKGEKLREYHRGDELVQSILYASVC